MAQRTRHILIVSPGDIEEERDILSRLCRDPGSIFHADSTALDLSEWHEDTGSAEIPEVGEYDLILFVLCAFWGRRSGRYSSAFKRIYSRAKAEGIDRLLYFRALPEEVMLDPDRQSKQVIAFRDEVERAGGERCFWYDDARRWVSLIENHITGWLRGELPARPEIRTLPDHQRRLRGWTEVLYRVKDDHSRVAFRTALRAYALANEGRFTRACRQFVRAIGAAREPYLINDYGIFLKENGLLNSAEKSFEDLARLGQFLEDRLVISSALRHLGDISERKNQWSKADRFYRRAMAIERELDRKGKQAALYRLRGVLYLKQGSLSAAEKMFDRALRLYRELDLIEGRALVNFCLTGLYIEQGKVDRALEAGENALALFEQLGETEMAEKLRTMMANLEDENHG